MAVSITGKAGSKGTARRAVRGSAAEGPLYKVMVTLRGVEAPRDAANRAEKSAAMRAAAKEGRAAVVAWLKGQDVAGQYKRVSEPTVFGTFTLECTAAVVRLLNRAPGVQSVVRVGDAPLEVVSRTR